MADVGLRVVRRPPPGFWTSCAWSVKGRHVFADGRLTATLSQVGPYQYCTLCGVIVPNVDMPQRTVTAGRNKRSRGGMQNLKACFDRDTNGEARCFYCGRDILAERARLDHFIPRSRGGPDGLENRRASCEKCDVAKGARMPWEFMPERFTDPAG